ncbi:MULTISPECIES: cytochrome bd-I oxidase subunit CydX [unclassified Gilliamella]|nr:MULTISPECIES: cytochrome bd-I oxidase subunit CydX [Gilliamella]MCX8580456.1 cytochrome bd-I oxidase subunit CydX [Gilliamella sp. B3482]MCX8584462.1 cytochrome bd-I oxidase subunit CydX [Gilliamella sp. B3372]MCX8584838.1 cytochrome bd-I oxidase subunit CydX [Gilliamella sp. B3562]MCX8593601.1 cytochrome bd-I oxidase subunit CydX [Gilliamella sp. B3367]MCX8595928.1 cytochrome bd-I oxidase subunit CydX [Gilliamella sp. B3493]
MYYFLWLAGLIAACMLAVVTGLWLENNDKETKES